MSVRYINDRFLPDKAIDLMDEAVPELRWEIFLKDFNDGYSGTINGF